MEAGESNGDKRSVSSATAVLVGALAPGVNAPTWNTLKIAFLLLGFCLAALLGLAFSSKDSDLLFHVALLLLITATLFFLLCSFLAETGLVSVDHQMKEMGLITKSTMDENKKAD